MSDSDLNQPQGGEPAPSVRTDDADLLTIDFRKMVISAFILWHVFAVTVWLLPAEGPRMYLAGIVQQYLLFTGCWQEWTMFSPNPATTDTYVEAAIDYADSTHRSWNFPRTSELSYVQGYQRERFRKMIENTNNQRIMWPYLARYAAIENDRAGDPRAYPMTVHLVRHFRAIAPPQYASPPFQTAPIYSQTFTASPVISLGKEQ